MTALVPLDGKLSKYTNVVKGWQNRYFILNPQQGILEYHISQTEAYGSHHKPRGSLLLAGAVIAPSIEDEFTFSVNAANGEVYKLRAVSTKERQEWISRLRAVAHHFTSQIAQEHPPLQSSVNRNTRGKSVVSNISSNLNKIKGQMQQNLSSTATPNTSARSKTSVNESSSVNALSSGALSGSQKNLAPVSVQQMVLTGRGRADSRASLGKKSTEVRRSLQTSDVKELQDAREALVSADNYHAGVISMLEGLYYPSTHHVGNVETSSQASAEDAPSHQPLALDPDVLLLKSTSTAMMQSLNSCYFLLQKYQCHVSAALPPDAEVSWVEPRNESSSPMLPHHSDPEKSAHSVASFEVPSLTDPNDEVEDPLPVHEQDLGPVDEHKNVIMHLLSQLKLGMDLTKVTLPTFILERRSLLEMYADFAGHTELFTSIPDGKTPEERMCRVLKFYLSSFHCGRQSQIAKKPYNPIVGEVFQCSYYVPKNNAEKDTAPPSASTHHRVKFVSEQVSHHPPVSAFYIACPDKNISIDSHIWTKSKFMNMSIGVNCVGEGVLALSDFNERYTMTYPSAYARSILTVPWSELGGRCTISCQSTGTSASVVFHTKPMYGGQPHRVTAEARNKNGFIFCRADGRWNGELEFNYYKDADASGGVSDAADTKGRTETMDLSKLRIFHKYIRPLEQQSRMESRKLWSHVTNSLSSGDISCATQHKTELENQQREIEKQRQNAQLPVPTAFFSSSKGKDFDIYSHRDILK